ncbi:hypothetical protein HPP92_010179 [Vanilla planifolia]|uniref:Uncharacterized protein n=1 Tax=Vanilla planifolia TaxID=51239 RepID=A0A835V375_VANPL|nr:hypothetical protein HPP92_010179 [Vanilla planifolia]
MGIMVARVKNGKGCSCGQTTDTFCGQHALDLTPAGCYFLCLFLFIPLSWGYLQGLKIILETISEVRVQGVARKLYGMAGMARYVAEENVYLDAVYHPFGQGRYLSDMSSIVVRSWTEQWLSFSAYWGGSDRLPN